MAPFVESKLLKSFSFRFLGLLLVRWIQGSNDTFLIWRRVHNFSGTIRFVRQRSHLVYFDRHLSPFGKAIDDSRNKFSLETV
mmetsp:Transcript_81581/g.236540  ORF Transcript_81581/g.236540 Transcript_81581/m.236540 type:complete len:82 (-) Transcript_81581:243-488(-)